MKTSFSFKENEQFLVIPANAGIHAFVSYWRRMDSRFRGNDRTAISTAVFIRNEAKNRSFIIHESAGMTALRFFVYQQVVRGKMDATYD